MKARHPLITKLLTFRLALGLQQQEVADAGGLNRNTVGTIESGKRGPSLEMFTRYCTGLGYRLEVVPIEADPLVVPTPARRTDTYSMTEMADLLKVSRSTLYTLIREGKIDSVKNGRFRIFTQAHIDKYMLENGVE